VSAADQVRAVLGLRALLFSRRLVQGGQWVRLAFLAAGALMGVFVSASLAWLAHESALELAGRPDLLAIRGGPLPLFAAWVSLALIGRLWFGLLTLAQAQSFLDPRRFRLYPLSPRLLSAMNLIALLFDASWLILYPPMIAIALGISRIPGAPSASAMLVAEAFAVFATASLLHLGAALAALLDARPLLRRGFSIVLVLAGFAGFQLSMSMPGQRGIEALFAPERWEKVLLTPPGWMALLADRLSSDSPGEALLPAALLAGLGVLCTVGAHALSQRELVRPPDPVRAASSSVRGGGWSVPLLGGRLSALFEKEAKTALRLGWLQLVIVPVAYLLLVRAVLPGPEPLLVAAVYAHLGVLEIATNGFGRDLDATRAWFVWPVTLRAVLFAKNAVAYLFSLAIFLSLAAVAALGAHLTGRQFLVGILAHAAVFPLLATFGNAVSIFFPMPVRGTRLRRVRGAGPVGARLFAMVLLAGAGWAPWAIAHALGLPVPAAYAGELLALLAAYPALLGAAARLMDSRRESLLGALARDE